MLLRLLFACAFLFACAPATPPAPTGCAANHGGCSDLAHCDDSTGAVVCTCAAGYEGDGHRCAIRVTNPCDTANGGCDAHATCAAGVDGVTCTCNSGWTGSGASCSVIPENPCGSGNGGCDPNATCAFDGAARTCTCQDGFTGDGLRCTAKLVCTDVAAHPDASSWDVRAPGIGFGRIFDATTNGHQDVFLENPSGRLRLGIRRDWGGSVVFWGLAANANSNTIDANDTGRELQLALYDPTRNAQQCAWNASCLVTPSTCAGGITYLGWDPVQGGDECNRGAQVLSAGRVGDALSVVVQPVQWNPDWDRSDCANNACSGGARPVGVTYRLDFRFVREHVVEVAMEVSSQETFSHPPTEQEFPTLYVAHGTPDLPLLLDAAGQQVPMATRANDGFYMGSFVSPRPWVTWQGSDRLYGVGLATDSGVAGFTGWRGDGTSAPYFHNVRPRMTFGLSAGGTVRGIAYLALGSFATVQSELEAALSARPPFGYLDAPAAGGTQEYAAGEAIAVGGWVLDTAHVAAVDVEVDGQVAASAPVTGARPDVCAVYPDYDGCPNVGFSAQLSTAGLSSCAHLLRVVARDADGNLSVLGERVLRQR